jgi:hypothetical protein
MLLSKKSIISSHPGHLSTPVEKKSRQCTFECQYLTLPVSSCIKRRGELFTLYGIPYNYYYQPFEGLKSRVAFDEKCGERRKVKLPVRKRQAPPVEAGPPRPERACTRYSLKPYFVLSWRIKVF